MLQSNSSPQIYNYVHHIHMIWILGGQLPINLINPYFRSYFDNTGLSHDGPSATVPLPV